MSSERFKDETIDGTKILVFDKDTLWARSAADILEESGFFVDCVTEDFKQCLIKSAQNGYALAVINVHSLDDREAELRSFSDEFPAIAMVLVENWDDPEIAKLLYPPQPRAWYRFGNKSNQLITQLDELVRGHLIVSRMLPGDLEIIFPDNIDELLTAYSESRSGPRRMRASVSLGVLKNELRYVISQLFSATDVLKPSARVINVEAFGEEQGRSSSILFQVTPNVLENVRGKKSAVLKFGPTDDTVRESINYELFVEWFLTFDQTVRKIGYASGNYFAGLLYSYPRDVVGGYVTFANFMRDHDANACIKYVQRMFDPCKKQWLGYNAKSLMPRSDRKVQTYYVNHVLHASIQEMGDGNGVQEGHFKKLSSEIANVERSLRETIWSVDRQKIIFEKLSVRIPNPLTFIARPIVDELEFTLVHGDMHAQNILIDEASNRYFMIDFFYTGPGHIYRDFIELELSVRYDLFSSRSLSLGQRLTSENSDGINYAGLKDLVALEKALVASSLRGNEIPSERLSGDLQKAFKIIKSIRDLAFRNSSRNVDHYYLGLAYSSLKALKYFYPMDFKISRLILAGLNIDELDKRNISRSRQA